MFFPLRVNIFMQTELRVNKYFDNKTSIEMKAKTKLNKYKIVVTILTPISSPFLLYNILSSFVVTYYYQRVKISLLSFSMYTVFIFCSVGMSSAVVPGPLVYVFIYLFIYLFWLLFCRYDERCGF
jgi:hypothetical protein